MNSTSQKCVRTRDSQTLAFDTVAVLKRVKLCGDLFAPLLARRDCGAGWFCVIIRSGSLRVRPTRMKKALYKQKPGNGGISDLLKELWNAPVALRGNIESADYKRYVLPLIFLRFLSLRLDDILALRENSRSGFRGSTRSCAGNLRKAKSSELRSSGASAGSALANDEAQGRSSSAAFKVTNCDLKWWTRDQVPALEVTICDFKFGSRP